MVHLSRLLVHGAGEETARQSRRQRRAVREVDRLVRAHLILAQIHLVTLSVPAARYVPVARRHLLIGLVSHAARILHLLADHAALEDGGPVAERVSVAGEGVQGQRVLLALFELAGVCVLRP